MNALIKRSTRQFEVSFTDGSNVNAHYTGKNPLSLAEIEKLSVNDDAEFAHALMEDVDGLLDLGLGHSIYFHPNRGDRTSKGIVLRVR